MLGVLVLLCLTRMSLQDEVQTAQGALRGTTDDGVVSYRGIPYGTVTEAGNRFKQAGLAPTWAGLRESDRASCSARATEPCLWLDVHAPAAAGGAHAVLAWVAGGAGPYDPALLVRQGIIVVVIHHRFGPMGFLCTEEEKIPGNAGAKDVVLALRWVRDNIAAFRGNPANVVVGGQGLGAAIVEGLLLSPMAEGLFQGAIMQSGTLLSPWAFNYDALQRSLTMGRVYTEDDEVTESLLEADTNDLVDKADELNLPYFPFGMCAEKAFRRGEIFLSEPPFDSLSNQKARKVPLMMGFNSDEGYIFAAMLNRARILQRMAQDLYILLPEELKRVNEREMKEIKEIYFNGKVNMTHVITYHTDAYFLCAVHRSARLHAASAPVYYYQYSHAGAGVEEEPGAPKTGAAHADELALLFPIHGRALDGADGEVQATLVRLWTSFVKYLEPTRAEDTPRWETCGTRADNLLELGAGAPAMRAFPRARPCRLWDQLFERHYYNKLRHTG